MIRGAVEADHQASRGAAASSHDDGTGTGTLGHRVPGQAGGQGRGAAGRRSGQTRDRRMAAQRAAGHRTPTGPRQRTTGHAPRSPAPPGKARPDRAVSRVAPSVARDADLAVKISPEIGISALFYGDNWRHA